MQQLVLCRTANCVIEVLKAKFRVRQCQGLIYLFRPRMIISSFIGGPIGGLERPPCDMIFEKACPTTARARAATPSQSNR